MSLSRTYLYVPADRESVMDKAGSRGADALILDLEDAVAPSAKPAARELLDKALTRGIEGAGDLWVRINPANLERGSLTEADLAVATAARVRGFIVAKTETVADLEFVMNNVRKVAAEKGLGEKRFELAPIIESAPGFENIREIARFPEVVRMNLGEVDAVSALGLEPGEDDLELLPLRMAIVVASSAAGIDPPAGSVYRDQTDPDGLRRSSLRLRRLGFVGRSIIHPNQVEVVHEVFTPTPEQVAAARRVAERYEAELKNGNGVYLDEDGQMVDIAVIRAAWRTLDLAPALS